MILGFVMIKSAPTQTFIEQYLSPAVDGVSDRVKLSRLRRQIRTLSIRLLPFFTCAIAVSMMVHGCQVGLIRKAQLAAGCWYCVHMAVPLVFLRPVFGAAALKSPSK